MFAIACVSEMMIHDGLKMEVNWAERNFVWKSLNVLTSSFISLKEEQRWISNKKENKPNGLFVNIYYVVSLVFGRRI